MAQEIHAVLRNSRPDICPQPPDSNDNMMKEINTDTRDEQVTDVTMKSSEGSLISENAPKTGSQSHLFSS